MDSNTTQPKHIVTTKEKMDAILGITGGQSVDEFLDDLQLDTGKIQDAISNIDNAVKSTVQNIDDSISSIENNNQQCTSIQLSDMQLSLKEVEELIVLSKQMFKHIAESILSSDLIDSELVHAVSVLMESIRLNIVEFIQIYKSKQQFLDKVRYSMLQQQQKKELMALKHQYDLAKIKAAKAEDQNVVNAENTVTYSQEDIVKMLDRNEKQN